MNCSVDPPSTAPRENRPSRALSYARLLRIPNVFTAIADIALGAFVTGDGREFGWLAAASACLYSAGMVWNDVFDLDQDSRERPFRPLPSGMIPIRSAHRLGATLLLTGFAFATVVGIRSAAIAGALVVAILGYDAVLKRTRFGPAAMGACRFLNVLLGLSAADWQPVSPGLQLHLAAVVGIYVLGVTWFARTESRGSSPRHLTGASWVVAGALALALPLPLHGEAGRASWLFPYLLTAIGIGLSAPALVAIRDPAPPIVQRGVKTAILGLIALDAILATAISGVYGLSILVLLPPAVWIGRRVYST